MSSTEHDELVAIIRGVAEKLRMDYSKSDGNYERIWKEHLNDVNGRKEYAKSMYKLATKIWLNSNFDCRIHWSYDFIKRYFFKGGLEKCLNRERYLTYQKKPESCSVTIAYSDKVGSVFNEKCKLLDVGSCYNPFSKFEEFDVISIDLTPATEDVYACDFLQVDIIYPSESNFQLPPFPGSLLQLHGESFHVVVFSLFLSYLPAAEQRLLSCSKAWNLLIENGLLLIITPDSKSQNYNASMIKSWRIALEHIGFKRIMYEKKKYLHCMAFRKVLSNEFNSSLDISKMMYIPQDFKVYADSPLTLITNRTKKEDDNIKTIFYELPFVDDL